MIEFIIILLSFFLWLFLSIMFHEFGHLIYMNHIFPGKNIKIKTYYNSIRDMGFCVGEQEDYDNMTNKQYFMTNFSGITGGLLFIIFGIYFINPAIIWIIVPYLFGSFHDIKEMIKVCKK